MSTSAATDVCRAAALQPNGKIVVVGLHERSEAPTTWPSVRLQPGGVLDSTFSFDGKTTLAFAGKASAAALCSRTGRIVVGGHDHVGQRHRGGSAGGRSAAGRRRWAGRPRRWPGWFASADAVPASARRSWAPRRRDRLRATRRADVIAALGGNDRVWPLGATTALRRARQGPAGRRRWKRPAARRPRGRPALRRQGERPAARWPRRGPPPRRRRPRHMPRRWGTRPRLLRDRAQHVTERRFPRGGDLRARSSSRAPSPAGRAPCPASPRPRPSRAPPRGWCGPRPWPP